MSSNAGVQRQVAVLGTGGSRVGTSQGLTIGAPSAVISEMYFQVWRGSNDDHSEMCSEKRHLV